MSIRIITPGTYGTSQDEQLARENVWWPKMDKEISDMINACQMYAKTALMPKETFQPWPQLKHVWTRVLLDFTRPVWGSKWLVIINAKTKFLLVSDIASDTSATRLCTALEQAFDWSGPLETFVSDNGAPFSLHEMKKFYEKYGIEHIKTALHHPASNGIAERLVPTFKEGMARQQEAGHQRKDLVLTNVSRSYRWLFV